MKIAYITAGAGHMYCGSCLRDNTLAAALLDAGPRGAAMPAYTPTRTDEPNVSQKRVFLGGINVFLQQHLAFFRKTPWSLDRLLDFPPLLRLATRWAVSVDPAQLGEMTVSMLRGPNGFQRKEIAKLVDFLADDFSPDIVTIPNSLLIGLAPAIKAALKVPICCTFQGEELFLDGLGEPYRSQSIQLIREHAAHVDAFVAVSHFGAMMAATSESTGAESASCRSASTSTAMCGAPAMNRNRSRWDTWAASRPRRGCTCSARRIGA